MANEQEWDDFEQKIKIGAMAGASLGGIYLISAVGPQAIIYLMGLSIAAACGFYPKEVEAVVKRHPLILLSAGAGFLFGGLPGLIFGASAGLYIRQKINATVGFIKEVPSVAADAFRKGARSSANAIEPALKAIEPGVDRALDALIIMEKLAEQATANPATALPAITNASPTLTFVAPVTNSGAPAPSVAANADNEAPTPARKGKNNRPPFICIM